MQRCGAPSGRPPTNTTKEAPGVGYSTPKGDRISIPTNRNKQLIQHHTRQIIDPPSRLVSNFINN